jgi:hypothetical protein
MASPSTTKTDVLPLAPPACPLCHTVDRTTTPESLAAGATWVCGKCGQRWGAMRLATVAAYAEYVATHPGNVKSYEAKRADAA